MSSLKSCKVTSIASKKNPKKKIERFFTLKNNLIGSSARFLDKNLSVLFHYLDSNQLLFEGFDALDAQEKEQTEDSPAHKRRKPNRKGQDAITLDPNLPVKTVIIDVPEEEKICKETGISLVQIGVETTHKLAHEPGSYSIKEIIRPK